MNIFKTKKFILTTLIFVIFSTLSFGMLQVFRDKNNQPLEVQAFTNSGEDVDFKSIATVDLIENGWTETGDGVFSSSVGQGSLWRAQSKTLKITITVPYEATLSVNIAVTSGSLSIEPSNIATSGTTTINISANLPQTLIFKSSSTSGWSGSKGVATVTFVNLEQNLGGLDENINEGHGSVGSPYMIDSQEDFASIETKPEAYYALKHDITLSGNFTPIGSTTPFAGTLDGKGFSIKNLRINGGNHKGLFSKTNGATIKDLKVESINITNITAVSSADSGAYSGLLIGYGANNTKVENVHVSGTISANCQYIGGIVGYAEGANGVVATNSTVSGMVYTSGAHVGGLSGGGGGNFTDCIVYADIVGRQCVGGLTGGYKKGISTGDYVDGVQFGSFTRCFAAGNMVLIGDHNNNYPYLGLVNGYGSVCKYTLSDVGQKLTVNYTSSQDVEEIKIFNSDKQADGVVPEITKDGNNGTFKADIKVGTTYAGGVLSGLDLLSDTEPMGVTGNYGGFIIRFKMADGTFKYTSTIDKNFSFTHPNGTTQHYTGFKSNFDVNLDNLTSYVDNFANIQIDTTTRQNKFVDNDIDVWGTALIDNANDFEHLSWIINGGIATNFANASYNSRSVATISVELQNDIDLTTERKTADGKVLNKNPQGEMIYNFYGFGVMEMHPYRGSLYGKGHSLKVNMNLPGAYILGVLNITTNEDTGLVVEDITINGTILGRQRVGILGMHDNFVRKSSVTFNNVINNANITAENHVGAFIGEAQGNGMIVDIPLLGKMGTQEPAKIYLNNCVNYGTITATVGDAGGFAGSLDQRKDTYGEIWITDCSNHGKVIAKGYAGGFVGTIGRKVNVSGTNIVSGIVTSQTGLANFYVGLDRNNSGYTAVECLKTIYKVNLGVSNATWDVSATGATLDATQYDADEFGVICVGLINTPTFSGVKLNIAVPKLVKAVEITPQASNTDAVYADANTLNAYKNTMATFVVVPISITLLDNVNIYETTKSTDNWIVKAVVTNNDDSTETITLTINLDENQMKSNQLVFANVTFSHSKYNVSEFSKYLYRITDGVENYVKKANELINKNSGSTQEFSTLGSTVKSSYDSLLAEMKTYGSENETYFKNYILSTTNICKVNVSNEIMAPYYAKIAKIEGINDAEIKKVTNLNYGVYSFVGTLTITMLDGSVYENEITYSFVKSNISNDLKVVATTAGVEFKVGEVVTCSYKENANLSINKIDILNIEIEDKEFVFDSTEKTTTATLSLLTGDSVEYDLKYTQNSLDAEVKNVGTYNVEISSISGDDARFYNIPAHTLGTIEIKPIQYKLTLNNQNQFNYDTTAHARSFDWVKLNDSFYDVGEEHYSVVYSGETYNSKEQPKNVGAYRTTIAFNTENFVFVDESTGKTSNQSSFDFAILSKQIDNVNFNSTLNYNAKEHSFEFEFDDVFETEKETLKINYVVRDLNGKETRAINAGNYKLQIIDVGNANYHVQNLIVDFVINQADITIALENQTLTYGDEISLNQNAFKIIEGEIFENEEEIKDGLFTLTTSATSASKSGHYSIVASNKNANYNITINQAELIIEKREVTIDFGNLSYDYNAQNQYSSISPTITSAVFNDLSNIKFKLLNGENETTEFVNAGTYKYKLIENETTNNYIFKDNFGVEKTEETYVINQKKVTVSLKETVVKNYNKEITKEDFKIVNTELAGSHKIDQLANFEFEVSYNGIFVDYSQALDVNIYVVTIKFSKTELGQNYDIETVVGELQITESSTYFETDFVSKFYDERKVDFKAKLFDADNIEITNAEINYFITKNDVEQTEIKEVGTYKITVTASAGDNYAVTPHTFTYVVNANVVTIALNNANPTYNGNKYVPQFTISMSEEVSLDDKLTYEIFDKEGQTAEATNVDDYTLSFNISDNNYNLAIKEFKVSIKPIDIDVKIKNREVCFGDEFDIQTTEFEVGESLLQGDTLDLMFELKDYLSVVGDYVLDAKSLNKNYNANITSAILSVKQRELIINFEGYTELVYNALGYPEMLTAQVENALSADVYSIYYQDENKHQITEISNVGEYYLVVELVDTHNYKFASTNETIISKQFEIIKLALDLFIDIEGKTYDGEVVEFKGVFVNQEEIDVSLYVVEYLKDGKNVSQPKDAGIYVIRITEKDEKNYSFKSTTKQFEIEAREISLAEIAENYDYSRSIIKPTLTLNNVVEQDDVKIDYEHLSNGKNFVDVGTYTIKINGVTGAQAKNYTLLSPQTINYNIVKVDVKVEIKNSEFVFTNKQIKQADLNIEFVSVLEILNDDFAISTLPTNVGEYEITFTSKNSNLTFDISSFNIVVLKAEINEIEMLDLAVDYDNSYHSLAVNKTILSNGVQIDVEYSANKFIDAGTYEVAAKLTNENYNEKVLTATLKINQIALSIKVSDVATFVYNASAQGVEIANLNNLWYARLIDFSYEGERYSSLVKPTNAGEYVLEIKANNANNINIINATNGFVINKKGITIQSTQSQTKTYNAQVQEFDVVTSGIFVGDVAMVDVRYNNQQTIPMNVGEYEITFAGLIGGSANNYYVVNSGITSKFNIIPYQIKVKADNKTSVYGDVEDKLTYSSAQLLGDDEFSGSLEREFASNKNINKYSIKQGSLTAGANYEIIFEQGIYEIVPRMLNYVDFEKEFTYNGKSQVPNIQFINLVGNDRNVVKVDVIGDSVNAGTYQLQLYLINPNYQLPEISTFDVTINKLDITENIICLIATEKDYNGVAYEPMVLIDGDFNYTMEYSLENEEIDEMIDAGKYLVKVKIDERNFVGEKTFSYLIKKIHHSQKVLSNISVEIASNKFILSGIDNLLVSVDGANYSLQSVENLNSKTSYNVFVVVPEDKNHQETKFLLGNYSTCASAELINQQIHEIIVKELNSVDINNIKDILKDCEGLTQSEQEILNSKKYQELINHYNDYFNIIEQDITEVNVISSIVDFKDMGRTRKLSVMISVFGFGILFVKGKKKNEHI